MSIEPFKRLVKLAARAFYDDITKGENQPKTGRSDNRGIAVVVLDALTRRQWVREEDLAKDLKLHLKQLRRILRFFEEEKLVTRDHRKETAKGAKIYSAAVAATADSQHTGKGDDKIKLHTHSYCCLDYAQIYDVVRYRLHRLKKQLKDELDNKNTMQEYICPNCARRYNALDALQLISLDDEYFHCENCNGELVAESDKLASQEGGDGDDGAKRRRREQLKDVLQRMEDQLKPLMDQLNRVKDLAVPEFGSLQAWEARASAAARAANGDAGSNDPSKSSQGGYSGTPMPFLGETKVEVAFSGVGGKEEDVKPEIEGSLKVLPPWMIKQGMNLTKEQRGLSVKQESKMDGSSAAPDMPDDKKGTNNGDSTTQYQDEYVKAYYAALLKQQQELEEASKQQESSQTPLSNGVSEMPSNRQVGMKSKHEEDEGEDDVEWEVGPAGGDATESYKVDLNVEAEPSGDDEDDIDWEEG
ncbi:transcription initiation factor IIE subunit alpha [Mercurialis annua]|uniref:transcription initiation factor IIE subunit alpha n=1 Tax=Mercurialis annua TaxID=3986 RepID=UPI00215E93BE|nr:transcription initiation factor IIE subunit alpha [Mercurialis annua]XP_050226649.1 transcription initiation factor IIE subunit alpha [Mercurialis annua]XP_050226650.1 transcription initiation factor IIE subunit alpha [Mercurialis annua]